MVDPQHDDIPIVTISEDMQAYATKHCEAVRVHRTRTSVVDAESGILGEVAFAEWYWGDWESRIEVLTNKGMADFDDTIEVKTSVFPFSTRLNLPIREDYARSRCPAVYVWACINVPSKHEKEIHVGLPILIVGWATGRNAHNGDLRTMFPGSPYKCFLTPVPDLRPMVELRPFLNSIEGNGGSDDEM